MYTVSNTLSTPEVYLNFFRIPEYISYFKTKNKKSYCLLSGFLGQLLKACVLAVLVSYGPLPLCISVPWRPEL